MLVNITNFEQTGLEQITAWIDRNQIKQLDEKACKEALRTASVFFVAEGINRVASTLLCELKASYIQQSQRYVTMDNDAFQLPIYADDEDNKQAKILTQQAYKLYADMSELKPGEFKGRPKLDNYQHGIPIEDARYILPLSSTTNLCITMSGDKLYDLFQLIDDREYAPIFCEFKKKLEMYIPASISRLLSKASIDDNARCNNYDYAGNVIDNDAENSDGYEDYQIILEDLYQQYFDRISSDDNMVLLDKFNNLDLQVGLGALTSTQIKTSSEILADWGLEATDKAKQIAKRVLGYGHDSIAEQARTTFGMMCSLVTYHQQVRHRLPESRREHFAAVINDDKRQITLPETVANSKFREQYLELAAEFKQFSRYIYQKYGLADALPFLLNCDQLKMIISSNARMDAKMLSERTCMNAQWEIRHLAIKKLNILRGFSDSLYETALPSCVLGKCKEGKLSCGRQLEVKAMFAR
jgi:thymidylate synthase ThyX